ncbi:MAG: DUF2079 domain-containing protein [Cyanobacteria bacterium J06633_2]
MNVEQEKQVQNRVDFKSANRTVMFGAIAFFVIVGALSLHRHLIFFSNTDHGIFNQVFWNSVHGRWFESSLSSALSTNVIHHDEVPTVYYHRLGQHFTPALLVWMPIYAIAQHPLTLAIIQVSLITAAGVVLYYLARQRLQPRLAAMIALSFYGANAVIGPALGNFYDYSQIPLYIFTLLLAMEKRWWALFWPMAGLTLLVREDAGVVLCGVGLYLILSRRYPKIGLGVCGLSIGYLLLVTNWAMPLFSSDISERFMIERFGQFVENDTASTIDIIWAIATQPLKLVEEIISPRDKTIRYLLGHWLPLAFVPAIAPASWTIAGLPLLQILLQQGTTPMSITVRYATAVIPGLFYGAIIWWSYRESLFKTWFRKFWILCISLSLIFTLTSNPHRSVFFLVPDSVQPWVYRSLPGAWSHANHISHVLAQIPENASVSSTRFMIPALSNRRAILKMPKIQYLNDQQKPRRVKYIVADIGHWLPEAEFRRARDEIRRTVPPIDRLLERQQYGVVHYEDGIVMLKRGEDSNNQALQEWQAFRNTIDEILN